MLNHPQPLCVKQKTNRTLSLKNASLNFIYIQRDLHYFRLKQYITKQKVWKKTETLTPLRPGGPGGPGGP